MTERDPTGAPSSGGLLGSLKGAAATLLEAVQTRLEIFFTEIEEEKIRVGQLLLFGVAALFFLGLGIIFTALFLTVLFWETHRLFVLGTLALLFLLGGMAAWRGVQTNLHGKRRLFADSLAVLSRDRDSLK
jgi:uncharacterized membrane protein YqjE